MKVRFTPDLGFAAALMVLGYRVQDELVEDAGGKKMFGFLIEENEMSREFASFRSGVLLVDAQSYAFCIKTAKRMLYGDKKMGCTPGAVGVT